MILEAGEFLINTEEQQKLVYPQQPIDFKMMLQRFSPRTTSSSVSPQTQEALRVWAVLRVGFTFVSRPFCL